MMDQEKGRFRPVSPERVAEMQQELDTLAASAPPDRPARTRVLPVLAENERVNLEIGGSVGTIEVQIDKIKQNGKLFVHQTLLTVPGLAGTPLGYVIEIKGVLFRLRRVNAQGVAGLRMMASIERSLWETAGKPQPGWPVITVTTVDLSAFKEPKVECTLENPSKRAYHVSTDAQLRRAEQKERRIQALAEKREKNRAIGEREREASKNAAVPGLSKKQIDQKFGAELAAKRKRARKLAPMLAAQEAARQKAEAEKGKRKEATPAAVVSLVVAGAV